jgi:hypothetical protein
MTVTREDGWVALQHYNLNDAVVQVETTKNVYGFTAKPYGYASITWVRPEDVDALLKVMARVCCGKRQNKFLYASQNAVNLWATGKR